MARQLKPQLLDSYESKALGSIPLYLNRNSNMFEAKVGSDRVEAGSFDQLRRLVREAELALDDVAWEACIHVSLAHEPSRYHFQLSVASAEVAIERFYLARVPRGLLKSAWDLRRYGGDEEGLSDGAVRLRHAQDWPSPTKGGEFTLPYFRHDPTQYDKGRRDKPSQAYLPYTQLLWDKLEDLQRRLLQLDASMRDLLLDPQGLKLLVSVGTQQALGLGQG